MAKLTRRIVVSQLFRLSCSRDISPSLHRQRSGHDRGHVVAATGSCGRSDSSIGDRFFQRGD
jgi:hypothetical protein